MTKKTKKIKKVDGFVYTTAIKKLRKLKSRLRIIPGGTSAGKTFGIIPILIDLATKQKLEISVVSETIPHLRKGAMRDFLKIMDCTGRYNDEHWNKSNFVYTFTNGSFIEFFSADKPSKVRGPRRDILYINECNSIDFETYYQLAIRTKKIIWLDFNPTSEFWVHTELNNDTDKETLILTYKDNEALPSIMVQEIEKAKGRAFYDEDAQNLFAENNIKNAYWANWWKVYGLGEVGSIQGVVFSDWNFVSSIPTDAILLGLGIDFGYSTDPTTIVALYRYNNEVYIDELCYRTGMTNKDIADTLKTNKISFNTLIVADCAEPKSIHEVNEFGFHVQASVKGADSINFGIDVIRQLPKVNITTESTNLIKEYRNYVWETDKNGAKTGRPIDAFNHGMDALRYIAVKCLAKSSQHRSRGVTRKN